MPSGRAPGLTERAMAVALAETVRDVRLAIGWTQTQLAARARTSQATVSRVEAAQLAAIRLGNVARMLDALGVVASLSIERPFVLDRRRQREPGHARCSGYVARRLEREGWLVATEVEISHGRSHGWIDILGFHPSTGSLVVGEVKTELHDLGRVQRTLSWYEREAWAAARRLGWRPRRVVGWLFVLATAAVQARLIDNRLALEHAFPLRPRRVDEIIVAAARSTPARALSLTDPLHRGARWLMVPSFGGRRELPYDDYADFVSRL